MSLYDYKMSLEITKEMYPFNALIMAAMRQADSVNIQKLKTVFPNVHLELQARYNSPGGTLPSDPLENIY